MISRFKQIVLCVIAGKTEEEKEEISRAVYKFEGKVGEIEKKLDSASIDLLEAMKELRNAFSYHLDEEDYRKIQKETGYNVR